MLEKQLDQIDNEETRDLFLGNQRRDRNQDRRHVLEKVDVALSDYGKAPPECCHITSCLSYLFLKSVFDYSSRRLPGQKQQDSRLSQYPGARHL